MCHVDHNRGRKILPHLQTIMSWTDEDYWPVAPADWSDLDIEYRERRVHPPCMICGDPAGFCRPVEMTSGHLFWADLCGDHMDPDRLLGL